MICEGLKKIIDMTLESTPTAKECEVTVYVSGESSIGASPSVEVRSAGKGIDWDSWQFMLYTDTCL